MLFNSLEFLLFLPIVFLLYWFVFRGRRLQNLLIVIASYVFYGWWDWRFLMLIALTSLCSYGSGLLIERYDGLHIGLPASFARYSLMNSDALLLGNISAVRDRSVPNFRIISFATCSRKDVIYNN